MAKKTQGLLLGKPWYLWRRFLLPGLILPCFLLMWDVFVEPAVRAATDVELAPAFYVFYQAASALLLIGVIVVGLRLFTKFRRFAQIVIDNGCQNCLRCATPLTGLPTEHNCPSCGAAYEMEIVVAKWRKATTIERSALIAAKCGKWFAILGLVAGPLFVAWGFYSGLHENRLYEADRVGVGKYYGPEPNDAAVLDVPYIRQTSLTDCGPASVSMMLQYHNIEFDASKLPSQIMTDPKHGSDMYPVVQYLKGLGAEPTLFYPPNVETLIWSIRKGVPVLVTQAMSEKEQSTVHAVVVIGATDSGDTLVIHDPFYGKRVSLNVSTFDRRWIMAGGYCRIALILSTEDAEFSEGLNPAYAHIAEQFELGRLYAATGDNDKAITSMQATVQAAPDFIPGYLYLGKCLSREDRPNDAADAFRRALQIDETYYWGTARFHLGAIQLILGQQEKAKLNLAKFLEGDPSALPAQARAARAALAKLEEPTAPP